MKNLIRGAATVLILAVCLYSAKFFASGSVQDAAGRETEAAQEKPLSARNEPESVPQTDVPESASQETLADKETRTESKPETESTTETETESVTETETEAASDLPEKETQTQPPKAGEKAQTQPSQTGEKAPSQPSQPVEKAPAQVQPPQPQPSQPVDNGVTEVSRVYIEDCGLDTGYWEITYSDGHVEHIDD